MDPFSIVVGSVALVETANTVASVLIDTYRSYKNAPTEMVDIADQMTLCAGLVDVFANSIKGTKLPQDFHHVAKNLVDQCERIFKDISDIIAEGRLKYAFGKRKEIEKKQKNLRRLQHMFMFLTTSYMYHPSQSQRGGIGQVDVNSLQGTLQHVPVQITMPNNGLGVPTILYEATLTLKPTQPSAHGREYSKASERNTKSGKHSLDNMRRSPYFSKSLLEPPRRTSYAGGSFASGGPQREKISVEDDEIEIVEIPSREDASRDVDKMLSRWFLSTPPPPSPKPRGRAPRRPRAPELSDEDEDDIVHVHESGVPYPEDDNFPPLRPTPSQHSSSNSTYQSNPNYPLRPAGSSVSTGSGNYPIRSSPPPPPRGKGKRSWDWSCDGCETKFLFDDGDKQFRCCRCQNFHFCEDCFERGVRHQHPRNQFAEVIDNY